MPEIVEEDPEPSAPAAPPVATCVPNGDEGCFAEEAYRTWLCEQTLPTPALALFRKGSPWVRAYVSRDLDSWDPSHRTRGGKARLSLDEEVIVLHPYKPTGGVLVVGQANAYGWTSADVVRADGTCVSLMADEITMKRPPAPKHAALAWDKIDDHTRTAWLAVPDVKRRAEGVAKACAARSDTRGCAKARGLLTDAVVANVN
jgi:hypothetical protein